MLPYFNRPSESHFWYRQALEHMVLMGLAMPAEVHAPVRKAFGKLLTKYGKFVDEDKTVELVSALDAATESILSAYTPPKWAGFLPSLALDLMRREHRWYLLMLENRHTPGELLYFTTKHHRDLLRVVRQSFDPSEEKSIEECQRHIHRLGDLSAQEMFAFSMNMKEAMEAVEGALHWLDSRPVSRARITLPTSYLEHHIHEGRYFIDKMRQCILAVEG